MKSFGWQNKFNFELKLNKKQIEIDEYLSHQ